MEQEESLIISLAKNNDEESIEKIIKRYRKMILVVIKEYSLWLKMIELDDFIQEGNIGILKAIKYFDSSRNVQFSTFVKLCIKTRLISFVTSYSLQKHNILTNTIYNSNFSIKENTFKATTEETYGSDRFNPEKILYTKELYNELRFFFEKELSLFEKEVFIRLFKGYSYKEICTNLKEKPKKLDNTIQRIRKKLKKASITKI